MPLISTSFPNLSGGVSQQPSTQRLENQCEAQENAVPLIIGGLVKRPPTEFVSQLKKSGGATNLNLSDSFVHFIQRDETEKYILAVAPLGGLYLYDLDGQHQNVYYPYGTTSIQYLADATQASIRATTIGDVTYLLNTKMPVVMKSTVSPGSLQTHEAMIWIKSANYGAKVKASFNLDGGGTVTSIEVLHEQATATNPATAASTADIAEALTNGVPSGTSNNISGPTEGLNDITDVTAVRSGSVIYVTHASAFTIELDDHFGGNAAVLIRSPVGEFSDLPGVAKHGQILFIQGDPETEIDDYYVKFVTVSGIAGSFGTGAWVETAAPGISYELDSATMPHILVRQPDLSWQIKPADGLTPQNNASSAVSWETFKFSDRSTGSDLTNPLPSFVGKTISEMNYFKGRLVFLSGENCSLSEAGEFFNFFRNTVTYLPDSAPIDVGVGGTSINKLRRSQPFSDRLVLFSDLTQFVLQGIPTLTPRTATITEVTNFNASTVAAPSPAGNTLFFSFDRGDFSGIREFYKTGQDELNFDAVEASAQVPKYIEGTIKTLATTTHEDLLVIRADPSNTLYAFKFLKSDQGRVQAAWFKMTFTDTEIVEAHFLQQTLYMVTVRDGESWLEKMDFQTGKVDAGADYVTTLDNRIKVVGDGADNAAGGFTINLTNTARPEYSFTASQQAAVQVVSTDGEVMTIASVSNAETAAVAATGRGDELVTGGGFSTDSDWTKSSGTTVANEQCRLSSSDGGAQSLSQTSAGFTATQGKIVEVTLTIKAVVSGSIRCYFLGGPTTYSFPATVGTHSLTFINEGTGVGDFRVLNTGVTDITFDGLSVKEVLSFGSELVINGGFGATTVYGSELTTHGDFEVIVGSELVTNGTFDTDITGWSSTTVGTGSASWDSSGKAKLSNSDGTWTNYAALHQEVTVVVGKTYRVQAAKSGAAAGVGCRFALGDTQWGNSYLYTSTYVVAVDTTVTATSTSLWIMLLNAENTGDATFDDVTVTEVIEPAWTKSAGATISSGVARIVSTAGESQYVLQTGYSDSTGKLHEISLDITVATAGSLLVGFEETGVYAVIPGTVGTHTATLMNNGPTGQFAINRNSTEDPTDITFDNVSVRQIMPPTGWTDASESPGSIQTDGTGHLQLNNPNGLTTEEGKAAHEVPVVIGSTYRVKMERTGGNSYVTLGSVALAADYWDSDFLTTDVDVLVVATTTSLFITARNYNSTTAALIDNVSTKEVLPETAGSSSFTTPTITLEEEFSATDEFYVGIPYVMKYEATKPTLKQARQAGGVETVVTGRHQLRYMSVTYEDTAFFKVKVTQLIADKEGETIEYPFSGRFLSTGGYLGSVPSASGTFRFPVFAQSDEVKIEIENGSPLPSNIQSIAFEAQYTSRSTRA
jgi:hypothetical protein